MTSALCRTCAVTRKPATTFVPSHCIYLFVLLSLSLQYHDPDYEGFAIGEYQFYDWAADKWDNSTCQTSRCAKMDCHLTDSRYQLYGVYTETDGLNDWAEQLFKHEGYDGLATAFFCFAAAACIIMSSSISRHLFVQVLCVGRR